MNNKKIEALSVSKNRETKTASGEELTTQHLAAPLLQNLLFQHTGLQPFHIFNLVF